MAVKNLSIEDSASLTGEYCYIQRVSDGFVMENSSTGGNTPGAFYTPASVTDKKKPLTENAILRGVYEATENRVPFEDGKYVVRYCQADGTIIAVEDWNVLDDAVIPDEATIIDKGGDATLEKQNEILSALENIRGGNGNIAHPFIVTDADGPVEGAEVWATTDEAGTNRVESGFTDSNGLYTFHLAAGDYWFWAKSAKDYADCVKETVA
jgi:hypothetical protein